MRPESATTLNGDRFRFCQAIRLCLAKLFQSILGSGTGPLLMSDAEGKLSGTMTDYARQSLQKHGSGHLIYEMTPTVLCIATGGLTVLTFLSTKLYVDESFMPFDC